MENRLLDEYKDSSANMRHYANHFVAFLSLFLALTGGLLSVLFGRNPPDSQTAVTLLQTFGLIVTILFWVMTESAHYLWGHFARRAAAIECKLNFEQYRGLPGFPQFRLRPASWASVIMLLLTTGFWTYRICGVAIAFLFCFVCVVIRILLLRFVRRFEKRKHPNIALEPTATAP